MIRCEKCGTWIDPGQKFCTSCGTPLRMMNQDLFPKEAVRRGTMVNGKPMESAGANRGLLVLAAVIALIAAGLGGWYLFSNIPAAYIIQMMASNPQLLLSAGILVAVPVIGAFFYLAAGDNRKRVMVHALILAVFTTARNISMAYRIIKADVGIRDTKDLLVNSAVLLAIAFLMVFASSGSAGKGLAAVAAMLSIILLLYQMRPVITLIRLMPDKVNIYLSTISGAVQLLAVFFAALALLTGGKKKEPVYGWG